MANLLVSIDVEEDMPEWRVQAQTTVRNLQGLPALHAVFMRLGVRPTYLCTWPVAARGAGWASMLTGWREAGECEIGARLNPWVTPPFDPSESRVEAVAPHRLSLSQLEAKVRTLTETVTRTFGVAPRAFRAGEFGIDGACLQVIERHGYRVDASLSPLTDARPSGGLDMRAVPSVPYFPHRQFPGRRGASPILEIPQGVAFNRALPESLARGLAHALPPLGLDTVAARLGGLARCALTPGAGTVEQLCAVADALFAADAPTIHFCARSPEFFAGTSGGPRSDADVHHHLEKTERFLAYAIHTVGAIPRTLSEFAEVWAGGA
ncbi:hypothetical protein L6V77_10285 [Myxococcota bacterium]|nr:hypothetical protein [Myxococcota bacterium]